MAGVGGTSKPKIIKALLSSFLKGKSKEETSIRDKEGKNENEVSNSRLRDIVTGESEKEGFVVIDEWSPSQQDQTATVQPQNRDGFIRRLETFSTLNWCAKPEAVSPLHCARFGWQNIETDSLKCVSCKEVVYGGLPPTWEKEAYQKGSQKLQESLKTGHTKVCPWPSNPSPASFLEVQLVPSRPARDAFLHRVASLRCFGPSVPAIDRSSMLQVNVDEKELSDSTCRLVTEVLGEEPTIDYRDRIETVCIIALCGWSRSSPEDSQSPTMCCEYCRRNVGLWNFSSLQDSCEEPQSTEEATEPAVKRLKVDKGSFDPLGEHRTWCPWIAQAAAAYRVGPPPARASGAGAGAEPCRQAWHQLLTLLLMTTSPDGQRSDGVLTNKETLLKSLDKMLGQFLKPKKGETRRHDNIQT